MMDNHYTFTPNLFFVPMYDARKPKRRYLRKFRDLPKPQAHLRMNFRSQKKRFNPWVFNSKPYVWKPMHKR